MAQYSVFPEEFGYYFSEGSFERIYKQTIKDFQLQMGLDTFVEAAREFNHDSGDFNLKHSNQLEPGIKRYQWVNAEESRMITVAYNSSGEIIGIQFDNYEKFTSDRGTSINTYRLPFEGEWFVLWGGNDAFLNYHYPYAHQRYAYDFIRKSGGSAFDGDEGLLEVYHAFGAQVVTPRGGEVIRVVNDVEDNLPHYPNMTVPEGNHIIISHGYNEYSLLAHLRRNSITVAAGDTVEAGTRIAQCGNSGASDTPHLHFHVMDGKDPYASQSIRIQFAELREPRQGDTVKGRSGR
ncbi:peptidoglycan DD-metalloendopeptidase family protein [Salinicoccus hispanicus]|uniref:lysostaphin n=1 Tax=Salinicoccus hispanicus TaxID=157225 RepID=A0A6N8U2E2_9STAP|nr:peptidoglycan DD-metalloendopeptidase family protein [Salinicoccus hispanicus]MXQ51972.1 peptidoglycan DD-metalloendopeptidase family protein [Salinicoccus hispanicus]